MPSYLMGDDELNSDFPFNLKIHHIEHHVFPHGHNYIEFTYAFQGQAKELINGVEHDLKPGTFTLLSPYQIHEIVIEPGNELLLYVGEIGLKALFGESDTTLSLNKILLESENELTSFCHLEKEVAEQILVLLQQMYAEIQNDLPWNRIMFKAKLAEVLVFIDRYRISHKLRSSHPYSSNRRKGIWAIVYYVYKNFRDDITLESLSEQFYLSVPHISSSFKQFSGESFHKFLEKIRIAHACSLLISSDLPITDITFEVGFKSYTTFVRVFQEHMKMSPTAYRKYKAISMENQRQDAKNQGQT